VLAVGRPGAPGHVADWHTRLRDTITDQQRLAVLRIKDVWHRLPSYPDEVSGWEVYTAVLRDGVRTPGAVRTLARRQRLPNLGRGRGGNQRELMLHGGVQQASQAAR
jgi:hypothetical protein